MSAHLHHGALLAALDGLTVGDGEAKKKLNSTDVIAPQVVLYMLPGGSRDGAASEPDEWVDWRFGLTGIGRLPSEALDYLNQAEAQLRAERLEVTGWAPALIRRIGGVDAIRDDTLTPALFAAHQVYGWQSFPATGS